MKLVEPLVCGFPAAHNGTAEIYTRATLADADCFSDFEGAHAVSNIVPLDTYGAARVYIDGLCAVYIKDDAGAAVTSFIAGTTDVSTEVISSSFTGTNYGTGATAVGDPTNLRSVLDAWVASSGSPDWKVLFNGADTDIKTVMGATSGVFFNTKTYGSVGDGTTDDKAAIQAAIDACHSAGGGTVYFPGGTYKTTDTLTVPHTVSLMGAGADASQILCAHASNDCISLSAYAGTTSRVIEKLGIGKSSVSSGNCIFAVNGSTSSYITIRDCHVGIGSACDTAIHGDSGVDRLTIESCHILVNGTGMGGVSWSGFCNMTASDITSTSAALNSDMFVGAGFYICGCLFDASAVTSGTFQMIYRAFAGTGGTILGCAFSITSAVPVCTGIASLTTFTGLPGVFEFGNSFAANITKYAVGVSTTNLDNALLSRDPRSYSLSFSTGAAHTVPADQYGLAQIISTYAGTETLALTKAPVGCRFSMTYTNGDGSARGLILTNVTYSTYSIVSPAETVAAGATVGFSLVSAVVGGAVTWICTSEVI